MVALSFNENSDKRKLKLYNYIDYNYIRYKIKKPYQKEIMWRVSHGKFPKRKENMKSKFPHVLFTGIVVCYITLNTASTRKNVMCENLSH